MAGRSYDAMQVIYRAARMLGVNRSTDVATTYRGISLDQANDMLDSLNDLLDMWSIDDRKVLAIQASQLTLTAGQQFYLIGTGAPASTTISGQVYLGINTPRPTGIEEANIIIPGTNPPVRYSMAIVNAQEWASIGVQMIPFAIPQALWYDGDFRTFGGVQGLGALSMWPGPNSSYLLELFQWQNIAQLLNFPDLTTSFLFPPGYAQAVITSLAEAAGPLMRIYFKIPEALYESHFAEVKRQAAVARQRIDDYNARSSYMTPDPAFTGQNLRGAWNYLTGGFGRGL